MYVNYANFFRGRQTFSSSVIKQRGENKENTCAYQGVRNNRFSENLANFVFLLPLFHSLTHFMPLFSFYTPCRHQKTRRLLTFAGGIERDQWHEMG